MIKDLPWQRRALRSIAHGALTNSKRAEAFVQGAYPTHMKGGDGCYLTDNDGNRYVDFICGLGTNILGYGHLGVTDAIHDAIRTGCSLSFSTCDEVFLAEELSGKFPFAKTWRFLKTGSEATSAAIKIARAYRKKHLVLSAGYHGWADAFTSLTEPAHGVPMHDCIKPLGDINQLDTNVAAVIVEPVITDHSNKRRRWLSALRDRCTSLGIVLIFDEIITGFRFPKFSVSSYWNIRPDIICLGKAIANGMPLAAVGGKREIMTSDYFVSSTYAGERGSIAAARTVLSILGDRLDIKSLWDSGQNWLNEFNALWPERIQIEGYPTRGRFIGDSKTRHLFFQECAKAQILFGPSWFWNFPLMEDKTSMATIKDIIIRLKLEKTEAIGLPPTASPMEKTRHG